MGASEAMKKKIFQWGLFCVVMNLGVYRRKEISDILINELGVNTLTTSYELFLLHELWLLFTYELLFIPRVSSYFNCTSYELWFTSYELLFIVPVTNFFLTMSYNKDKDGEAVYDNNVMIKNYSLGVEK